MPRLEEGSGAPPKGAPDDHRSEDPERDVRRAGVTLGNATIMDWPAKEGDPMHARIHYHGLRPYIRSAMRRVTYQTIAHGALGDPEEGSLQEFLLRVPYLLVPPGPIPPLFVLNDVLAKGIVDAGMSGGCQWEPFLITPAEWEELASALARTSGLVVVEPAAWVRTYSDWTTWCLAHKLGIPLDEQLQLQALWDESERWRLESEKAGRDGNRDRMLEYHAKFIGAGRRAREIVERYHPY